jgi:NADH dehydrogenase
MGRVLVKRLHGAGNRIRIFTLPDDPNVSAVAEYCADIRYGDIYRQADVAGICRDIDIVYHLAAVILADDETLFDTVNVYGTKNLVQESNKEGVKHFIYISSASVVYPRPTPYSVSKRKCEEIVSASGLRYTIIRPTLVYGEQRGGQEFDLFLAYLKRFPVVPFIGKGSAVKRPVFVGDIINGLVGLNNQKRAYGKIYNFSGAEPISMLDFSRMCLNCMGMQTRKIVCVPVWLCKIIAGIMKLFMKKPLLKWQTIAGITQDANLDPQEAINDIDYNPVMVSNKLKECFPRI